MNYQTILSILGAFILGVLVMYGIQHYHKAKVVEPAVVLDDIFDNDFFQNSRDPFQEMNRVQKEIEKHFSNDHFSLGFDHWFDEQYGKFPINMIGMDEDKENIYYRLNTHDMDATDVTMNITNGMVDIEANLSKKGTSSESVEKISQHFPVPAGVNSDAAKIEVKENEIVASFPKN